MAVTNVLIAGVGGQGIILASDVMAKTAADAGLDVKKSDVHGMAQRGGAVTSHVRFGAKVYSPLIPEGEADIIMSSELLEAVRWLPFLKKGGRIAVSMQRIPPPTVARGEQPYPEDTLDRLQKIDPRLVAMDCLALARAAGNERTATIVLLGGLSGLLPFPEDAWIERLKKEAPKKVVDVNVKAFLSGRAKAR
ncbi:MAG TPA: indolepyruvate oxidoreductase subunit beta [bacterium]|nr:indolepyruvate oxidoreductase subunit beta [bacterium]